MSYPKYGQAKHPLYIVWRRMLDRCNHEYDPAYKDYGGRGIKVCYRWRYMNTFVKDMYPSYRKGLTLDRIDNNKGYSPENCRWATWKEQALNRRSNRWVELDGRIQSLYQWADELGIKRSTVTQRINAYNWTPEKALLTPVKQRRTF